MIDYTYFDLFQQDSVDKQLIIQFDNTIITNEDLFNQSLILEESLCSEEELRFGSCEASVLKFKVANIVAPMINKWLSVKMVLNNHAEEPFIIGRYKVAEDKLTADKQWREITAYDAMYDIINADMAAWYNAVFPDSSQSIPLEQFRNSFMFFFNLEQVVPKGGLVNDTINIEKTIQPEQISGKDIITAICEINGCFGHIGRDGKFHYIYLPQAIQGLYPANNLYPDHAPDYLPWQQRTGHLYPQDPKSTRIGADGTYIECKYEDYLCKTIDKLQIRQEENDIGAIVGRTGDNCYIIEDNFLVYGKGNDELHEIANRIFNKITDVVYRPFNADVKGNPCFEVGDPVRITTKYELIESYILQRTLKGIQALRDNYVSDGVETYSEHVNGVHKSIIQLKGKTNTITRTVEENRQEMLDIEAGLSFTIVETAKGLQANIEAEKQRAEGEESKLSTKIELTAEGLKADITKETERAEGEEQKLSNSIKVTAEGLQANIEAEKQRAEGVEESLSSSIKITAKKLEAEINEKVQYYDTKNYQIDYRYFKEPDIEPEIGKYWLDTSNGNLYIGAIVPSKWNYLGKFHSNVYVTGDLAGQHRWFFVGDGTTIYRKYGNKPGYNMAKNGGFNETPPEDDNFPLNSWWMDIHPISTNEITLEQYLNDLEVSNTDDYMDLYEKVGNLHKEWKFVETLQKKTLSDLGSSYTQIAGSIVLKVNSNGDIAQVALTADPETGTIFKVKADNITLTAEEIINLMSNGDLNLGAKNLKITSDNFNLTPKGNLTANNAKFNNVKCKNIKAFSIDSDSLEALKEFSTAVDDSESMRLAQQAISTAQSAASAAQSAASTANTTANNLRDTIIPDILAAMEQLNARIVALESK